MDLLLTGFEPFGGATINPSEQVIHKLIGQEIDGAHIRTEILPVDRFRGPEQLIRSLGSHLPDAAICLGEASGRSVISLERIAINLLDFRIPDNSGVQVVDEPIIPDGPAAYMSTLPLREIHNALKDAGIPVELSLSAGSFLCNQSFYQLMHFLANSKKDIPAGFIHLPALPEQAAIQSKLIPSMSLELSLAAVREVVRCIVGSVSIGNKR
jgi:pyroglutamyl-peptidase